MLDALHSIRGQLAVVYTVLICGLWLYAFVHILRAKAFRQGNKALWVLLCLLAPGIGPLIYLAVGRPQST